MNYPEDSGSPSRLRDSTSGTPTFVLDEPTSALDPLAEVQVYHQFLEAIQQQDGSFDIPPARLGSISGSRTVLKDGRIIEEGTHDELVEAGGAYSELFAMQAEWYR